MQDNAMMIRADAKAQGMVTAQRVLVNQPWTATATRAIGTAFDDDGKPVFINGQATVRIRNLYDASVDYYRTVGSFRGKSDATIIREVRDEIAKTTAADLPPVFAD